MTDDAPPRPDDALDILDNLAAGEEQDVDAEGVGGTFVADDVSCDNCAHRQVCGIRAGITPMLERWEGGSPIHPDDLAVICAAYEPSDEHADE